MIPHGKTQKKNNNNVCVHHSKVTQEYPSFHQLGQFEVNKEVSNKLQSWVLHIRPKVLISLSLSIIADRGVNAGLFFKPRAQFGLSPTRDRSCWLLNWMFLVTRAQGELLFEKSISSSRVLTGKPRKTAVISSRCCLTSQRVTPLRCQARRKIPPVVVFPVVHFSCLLTGENGLPPRK